MYTYFLSLLSLPPNPPVHPVFPFPALCPHIFPRHLYLYFCSANRFICTIFLDSTYMHWYWYSFFSFWLTSLCKIVSRSICVSINDNISSFYGWVIFHCIYRYMSSVCICTTSSLSIHLSLDIEIASTSWLFKQCCSEQWALVFTHPKLITAESSSCLLPMSSLLLLSWPPVQAVGWAEPSSLANTHLSSLGTVGPQCWKAWAEPSHQFLLFPSWQLGLCI